jgi:hypothetical protein
MEDNAFAVRYLKVFCKGFPRDLYDGDNIVDLENRSIGVEISHSRTYVFLNGLLVTIDRSLSIPAACINNRFMMPWKPLGTTSCPRISATIKDKSMAPRQRPNVAIARHNRTGQEQRRVAEQAVVHLGT